MTTVALLRAATAQSTSMNTDREVVENALAFIEADGGWTQGTYCRDADGTEVHPAVNSPGDWVRVRTEHVGGGGYVAQTESGVSPCSYCLGGALRAAADYWDAVRPFAAQAQVDRVEGLLLQLVNATDAPGYWLTLDAYNDDPHTTRADAVLLLKRAAAHLDAQGEMRP